MKKTTLTGQKDTDLIQQLREKREALRSFRFSFGATKNVKEAQNLRRDIARIKTELASRETRV